MVEELQTESCLSCSRLSGNDYRVSASEPAFDYLIQARDARLSPFVVLLYGWSAGSPALHYVSSSKDQSFTGPTCRKLTIRLALRTCRYFDAVDRLTLRSLAISPIELLGLSPRV